jgi:Tfp pilus assembly protein PilF
MKPAVLVLACSLALPALAVDMPAVLPSSVSERMVSAREAIGRKGWIRAQYDLKAALRDDPGNADAHNLLAYTYRRQDKPDLPKAFEHYGMALQLDPRHKGAHEYIGEAYLMVRKPEMAESHLAELEKICGNRECEEYEDLAEAIAAFRKANPK